MSEENVEIVRSVYDHFTATQTLDLRKFAADAVIDMSKFDIRPQHPIYEGHEGVRDYIRAWLEPWDEYEHHLEALHDAGDEVVAILHISATAHLSGAVVEMRVGHVWAVADGTIACVTYTEPAQALEAAGLSE